METAEDYLKGAVTHNYDIKNNKIRFTNTIMMSK